MKYISTRGYVGNHSSADAIKKGIAPDGGLFVPEKGVLISLEEIEALVNMSYTDRAHYLLKGYLDDYTDMELKECVEMAYSEAKFDDKAVAPVTYINGTMAVLELWHGPTCAFKDMALQLLPYLLVKAVKKTGESDEIVILVATSGDTGKAALEGFSEVDGTRIIVFFPNDGVSDVQKLQMLTQKGHNTSVVAVEGNFDDTQSGVKVIFSDKSLENRLSQKGYKFSSANSINWGRLAPQIVYYFSAYADMVKNNKLKIGEAINFVVPTGNFGNILAGYYAKMMGLPIKKLICASNDNNVLTEFIKTGTYNKNREFIKTVSPSMDILISSNLERLLFEITGHNSSKVSGWMSELNSRGVYTVDEETKSIVKDLMWAEFCSQEETLKTIECVYKEYNYMVDTHTAVAIDVYDKYVISTNDMTPTVIVSTASPFKFNGSVAKAILYPEEISGKNEFELLNILSEKSGWEIPEGLKDLDKKEIRHKLHCKKDEMQDFVEHILGLS